MSFPLLRRGHVTRPRAGARATQTAQTKAISFALFLRAILIFDEIPPANPKHQHPPTPAALLVSTWTAQRAPSAGSPRAWSAFLALGAPTKRGRLVSG